MAIRVEHSTVVGERARQITRVSTGLQALPDYAKVSRPTKLNKDGKVIQFTPSEGFDDDSSSSWLASEGGAISGYERHCADLIDAGLCDVNDLL